jgi:hypothetical protein
MIRAAGFLTGLALVAGPALGWLLATGRLDVPALFPADEPARAAAPISAPGPLHSAGADPELAPDPPSEPIVVKHADVPPAPQPTDEAALPTGIPPAPAAPSPDPPAADPKGAGPAAEAVVWKPFRSERAARGFASHLTERYGVESDVRRDGPGVYRVIVSANQPAELESALQRVRHATGIARLEAGP